MVKVQDGSWVAGTINQVLQTVDRKGPPGYLVLFDEARLEGNSIIVTGERLRPLD